MGAMSEEGRSATGWRSGRALARALLSCVVGLVLMGSLLCGCSDAVATVRELVAKGDLAAAEEACDRALARNPADTEVLNELGAILMMEQKYDEALPIQEQVVAADPQDVQTRVELGFNYLNHQNRTGDAARVLAEAADLDHSAKNLTFLAQAQIAADEVESALQTLRSALDTDPGYPHSYAVLIALLERQGRYADAAAVEQEASTQGVRLDDSGLSQ
jgi:tetratricopeptide (TPR) repeat protein